MRLDRDLYYKPDELPVVYLPVLSKEQYIASNLRIVRHQATGLATMGCVVRELGFATEAISQTDGGNLFLNRIFGLKCTSQQLRELVDCRNSVSVEVNPYTQPAEAEEILVNNGFKLALSSVVLGKELTKRNVLSGSEFIFRLATDEDREVLYALFGSFFAKPGESVDGVKRRLAENLSKGPHIIGYNDGTPVAMAGAVVFSDTASAYSGIVDQEKRDGVLSLQLALYLENAIQDAGANFVYYKSRNRAVILGAEHVLRMTRLYNERIYEKRSA